MHGGLIRSRGSVSSHECARSWRAFIRPKYGSQLCKAMRRQEGMARGVAMKGMRWSLNWTVGFRRLAAQSNASSKRDGTKRVAKGVRIRSADISRCCHCREGTASGSRRSALISRHWLIQSAKAAGKGRQQIADGCAENRIMRYPVRIEGVRR